MLYLLVPNSYCPGPGAAIRLLRQGVVINAVDAGSSVENSIVAGNEPPEEVSSEPIACHLWDLPQARCSTDRGEATCPGYLNGPGGRYSWGSPRVLSLIH